MTRYLLSPRYRLRGWDKLPFGLVDATRHRCTFMRREDYALLMRCDGMQEIDREALSEVQRESLDAMVREGFVAECGPGAMIEPRQLYRHYPCHYKRSVHWSITGKCNYRCKHCLVSAPHA